MPGSLLLPGNTQAFTTDSTANAVVQRDSIGAIAGTHYNSLGSPPTAATGSSAGTSPPSPVVATSSTDTRGSVTGGTGTTPSAGALIVVTFNVAFSAAPVVTLTAANSATAALQPYVTTVSSTGFTIAFGSAPTASQTNTTYAFNWHALG